MKVTETVYRTRPDATTKHLEGLDAKYSEWVEVDMKEWDNLSSSNREILYLGERGIMFVKRKVDNGGKKQVED